MQVNIPIMMTVNVDSRGAIALELFRVKLPSSGVNAAVKI